MDYRMSCCFLRCVLKKVYSVGAIEKYFRIGFSPRRCAIWVRSFMISSSKAAHSGHAIRVVEKGECMQHVCIMHGSLLQSGSISDALESRREG